MRCRLKTGMNSGCLLYTSETLYRMADTKIGVNKDLLRAADSEAAVYTIEKAGGRYYVNTSGIAKIGQNDYFVQNINYSHFYL